MIELEKILVLTVNNLRNFSAHWIIKILLVLHRVHVVPRNQIKFVFYVNNNINWDQFNQLYNLNQIEKGTKNRDVVTRKLGLALTRVINHRLEVVREKKLKREEIVERPKTKAIIIKH